MSTVVAGACDCPDNEVLATVDPNACKEKHTKIARIIFQEEDDVNNEFVSGVNPIDVGDSWLTPNLCDAVDTTKVTVTMNLSEATLAEVDVIEGTENLDGAPTADGITPQLFTAMIEDPSPAVVGALNSLFCKSNLTCYIVYRDNYIQARSWDGGVAIPRHAGLRISPDTFIGSEPSREAAKGSKFVYKFQFRLEEGYYQNSEFVQAETGFNYGTDIKPA